MEETYHKHDAKTCFISLGPRSLITEKFNHRTILNFKHFRTNLNVTLKKQLKKNNRNDFTNKVLNLFNISLHVCKKKLITNGYYIRGRKLLDFTT